MPFGNRTRAPVLSLTSQVAGALRVGDLAIQVAGYSSTRTAIKRRSSGRPLALEASDPARSEARPRDPRRYLELDDHVSRACWAASVSGCSGPSSRSLSASTASNRPIASAVRPADQREGGGGARGELWGCSGPSSRSMSASTASQADRVRGAPRRPVRGGEVGARWQRGGVLGSEQPLVVGEHGLLQADRVGGALRGPVREGEVGARGERVGVHGSEQPSRCRRAPPPAGRSRRGAPRRPVERARLARACSVAGCSGPSSRSLSASTASCRPIASAVRSVDQYEKARLARAVSVWGCSGPSSRSLSASTEPPRVPRRPDSVVL